MARRAKKAKRQNRPEPEKRPTPPSRCGARHYAVLFLAALLVRLAYVAELTASPLSNLLLGDAQSYHAWALRLAGGDWMGSEVFYQAPAYPYFLGIQYALLGDSLLVPRLSQALLGALSCVLLAMAGARWFGPKVGLLAGSLFAVFAPAVFFVGLIQKTTVAIFLFCALLCILSHARPRGERASSIALGAGVLLGALALTRENALVLVAPVLLWLVLEPATRRSERLVTAACFAAGLALTLTPVLARNYHVSGEVYITTSQMGPNLYIGNNPNATGCYRPLREGRQDPMFERTDARELAEEALGRELTPAEVSSYYVSRVVDYVRTRPADWMALMGRKFALVWNATEVGDTEDLYAYASQFRVLALTLPLHFGILLPLAVLGFLVTWNESERGALYLLYALLSVYALSVVAFYVFSRYRFPVVPLVLLFASAALARGIPWFRRQNATMRGVAVALAALVLVGSNWPMVDKDRMQATTHYNLGSGLARLGKASDALREFASALEIEPDFAQARAESAVVLAGMGRTDEAVRELERALRDDPDDRIALANLGELELKRSRPEAAERPFTRLLELDPGSALAHSGLARVYFGRRELEAAQRHFELSLALAPQNPTAYNNLGVIAALRGDFRSAIAHFERAVSLDPSYEEARKNLERARGAS